MKIAFLIPSTTRGRKWRKMEDTYLYNIFAKSFLNTISEDIEYTIYINIDIDDPIYKQQKEKRTCKWDKVRLSVFLYKSFVFSTKPTKNDFFHFLLLKRLRKGVTTFF